MRHFNILAAVAVALLAGGVATAQEKPAQPKPKKICRFEEDSGTRIGGRRVCRIVADAETARAKPQQETPRPSDTATQTD